MRKIILTISLFFIFSANALSWEFKTNFTTEVFEQAQNSDKIVVVYSWNKFCGTCAKQKPILKQAKKDFKNILFLDFEQTKNKDIAKYLNINYWSTIVIYKNNKQINKAIGLTSKDEIYSLIKKSI